MDDARAMARLGGSLLKLLGIALWILGAVILWKACVPEQTPAHAALAREGIHCVELEPDGRFTGLNLVDLPVVGVVTCSEERCVVMVAGDLHPMYPRP